MINNGFSSGWFQVHKGMRQDCPLSCVLFILCVELLAHLIRQNKDIQGISLGSIEIKLSQFADDMCSFVSNEVSINALFDTCDKFTLISGLRLNKDKSQIIWLEPWKPRNDAPFGAVVSRDACHVLGVTIARNPEICNALNLESKVDNMKQQLNIWSSINLTLLGKVMVSKSMGLSNLVHIMSNTCINFSDL